jgi:hypothetical protein
MAPKYEQIQTWQTRLKNLEREIELMESGVLSTREKILKDGRPVLVDNTRHCIERNKEWMADLKLLLASKGKMERA